MNGEKKALFPIINTPTSWKLRHPSLKFSLIYTSQFHNNGGLSGSHYYPDKWKCCGDMVKFSSFYILDFFYELWKIFLLPSSFLRALSSFPLISLFLFLFLLFYARGNGGRRRRWKNDEKNESKRGEMRREKKMLWRHGQSFFILYIWQFFLWTLENIWQYINRALFFCKYW